MNTTEQRIRESHERIYQCQTWEHIEYNDKTRIGQKVHEVGVGCREHHVFVETACERGWR